MQHVRWVPPALLAAAVFVSPPGSAAVLQQDFSDDPAAAGWRVFGDTNLFHWNATNLNLEVTWDSSRPNSYFYHPLGTILARDDDFSIAFDLRLDDIGAGRDSTKTNAFEIALGLCNIDDSMRPNFLRGTGTNSPNLVEFDYFWPAYWGATISPQFVSTNADGFNYNGPDDFTLIALTPGNLYRVLMNYTASNSTMSVTMTENGAPFGPINSVPLSPYFADFRVGTFAITSYSDAGDDYDSVLGHGIVDNIVVTTPPPPVQNLSGQMHQGAWQAQFISRNHFLYTLERTTDFQAWATVSPPTAGNDGTLQLQDTNSTALRAFYRVRAERP